MSTITMADLRSLDEKDRLELEELREKLRSGELHADSPFPGMDDPWTDEQKQRLNVALAKVFGWDQVPVASQQ